MVRKELAVDRVAQAYLALLAERRHRGPVCCAGADFAPRLETFAKSARTGARAPQPLLATHENLTLAMAHGHAMMSGRVPSVIVHVSLGIPNGVCGVTNAERDKVPILFTAGRSPLTESGLPGGTRRLHPLGTGDVRPDWNAA